VVADIGDRRNRLVAQDTVNLFDLANVDVLDGLVRNLIEGYGPARRDNIGLGQSGGKGLGVLDFTVDEFRRIVDIVAIMDRNTCKKAWVLARAPRGPFGGRGALSVRNHIPKQ
jgi:hypothetical protein